MANNKAATGAGIGSGIGGSIGSGIARLIDQPLYDEMNGLSKDDLDAWLHVNAPRLEALKYHDQDPSAFGDIQDDASSVSAQRAALARLSNISSQGGLDSIGRSQLEQGRQAAAGMAAGARSAARSRAASRGMLGSGAAMAADAGADTAAVNRLSQSGYDAAAGAQQRNMDAIRGMGSLGSTMRDQSYKKSSDLAAAKDAINFHNNQNRLQVDRYNQLLPQQSFEDELQVQNGRTGARGRRVGYIQGQTQGDEERGEGIGSGIGGVAGFAAGGGFG